MSKELRLEIADDDNGCAMHKVRVNDMSLTIFQHKSGKVSLMVHGMERARGSITVHNHKVSKKFFNKHHTWSEIKVVE